MLEVVVLSPQTEEVKTPPATVIFQIKLGSKDKAQKILKAPKEVTKSQTRSMSFLQILILKTF